MSSVSTPAEQRVVIENVRWSTYLALLEDAQERRGRITYDRGSLEIMSPSKVHEKAKCLIGRLIETFTEEMRIEIESVASTTFKRQDMERGFEADESYYIENAELVRDKDEIDLAMDPPPDLVVEVDISNTSIGKLAVFGAFRVPEIWRYDGEALTISVLQGGQYSIVEQSAVIPEFPVEQAVHLLNQRTSLGETELIRTFRNWVRANLKSSRTTP